jgi:hypothetical protein
VTGHNSIKITAAVDIASLNNLKSSHSFNTMNGKNTLIYTAFQILLENREGGGGEQHSFLALETDSMLGFVTKFTDRNFRGFPRTLQTNVRIITALDTSICCRISLSARTLLLPSADFALPLPFRKHH